MKKEISKEKAREIMDVKEEARGITIKGKMEFILEKKGKDGLNKLEEKFKELGFPLKYKEIKNMGFYPIGYETLVLLLSEEIFNLREKDIIEMGIFVSRINLLIRMFIKYMYSFDLMAKNASTMWQKYYTIGTIETVEYDSNKKYAILRLKNYSLHPIHCQFLKGYFLSIVSLMVKAKVSCEETKCTFRGDKYHEFLLKW